MATIAVLGAGAVGGMVAVRAARAGARVVCVVAPATAAAIARDGLTLEAPDGVLRAAPQTVAELAEPVDLLVVAVKAYDLERALDRIRTDEVEAVLPLLNGLEHLEPLRARIGDRVLAGSIGRLEAFRTGPAAITQTTSSPLITIASEGSGVVALLREAGLAVETATELDLLWEKAARLAPLAAATAAAQRPVGEILADDGWRTTLDAALREACAVATAAGADVSFDSQWAMIGGMPETLTTSAARDVAAGRPSEIDAIAGAVVRAGRRLGVPTPTLDRLLASLVEP